MARELETRTFQSRWAVVSLLGCLISRAEAISSGAATAIASAPAATGVSPNRGTARYVANTSQAPSALPAGSSVSNRQVLPDSDVDNKQSWESTFAWGLHYSKQAVDATESEAGRWTLDREGSVAAVPQRMLLAEQLLHSGASEATPGKKRADKYAEEALRLYYHAKWLAERNLAKAAEWRYRESSRIAKEAKRSVLAAHSLSRLGYFLMHWRRPDEARRVLLASEQLNTKANPLGPFLYGLLERQTAGADWERLMAAEERILRSGKQPSEDLEAQRLDLVSDINYWRSAQSSPALCLQTSKAAHVLICLCSHAALAVQQTFQR